jgi:hypothetical protein
VVISSVFPSRSSVNTISDVDIVQVHVDLDNRESLSEEKRAEVMRVGNNNTKTANGYDKSIESKLRSRGTKTANGYDNSIESELRRRSHRVGIPREEANAAGSFVAFRIMLWQATTLYFITQARNLFLQTQNLAASNRFSSGDQIALRSTGGGGGSDMHVMASASLDGLSSTGSSSHPAFHSFPGGEINNNSTSSASSEFGDNLVRPEILTVVGGAQSGENFERGQDSKIERGRDPLEDSFITPDDKGSIPIDSMGHSATIPAITKLDDALEYIEGVDNGEGG